MTSDKEPLVSVVTPVYNGAPYLRECIESVLSQTYTNWDYTIVNNCSTDGTLDIAREYAGKDSRIRVVNNEAFVRVFANHNIALRLISPQSMYCKVVAADDWLFPECLEKMVHLSREHPSVAIVGAYGLLGTRVMWHGLPYPSTVVRGRELCRATLLGGSYVFGTPTSLLMRSDIVRSRNSFYNEENLHADAEVCYEFLENNDFGFIHQVLTYSRVREESLTSYSRRLNTYLAGNLHALVTYGPKYLNDEDFTRMLRQRLRDYYTYLGEQFFQGNGRDFWEFHRGKLASVGYPLSRPRLTFAALSYGLDLALNIKSTAERVVRRLMRMLSGSPH